MRLPEIFTQQMKALLGKETGQFFSALQHPPPVSIRLHPRKSTEIPGDPVPWSPQGRYLNSRPVFTLDPAFHAGAYYVQEASSMIVDYVIKHLQLDRTPIRILDAAAAPGGKTTLLLSCLHPESLVVANEVIRHRRSLLEENVIKWGYPQVVVMSTDPTGFRALTGFFDAIVLDAPCSGEGLFRKDPDAVRHWSPQHVVHCARRQQRIIQDLWPSLKTGGYLIYSTCTYNRTENEDNLKWLMSHSSSEPVFIPVPSAWGICQVSSPLPALRFYPHRIRGEGFFIAVVRKTQSTPTLRIQGGEKLHPPGEKEVGSIRAFLQYTDLIFFEHHNRIHTVPESLKHDVGFLLKKFPGAVAGTAVAEIKNNRIIPQHSLALSVYLDKSAFPVIELNRDQALAYLRKESLPLQSADTGFHLVTCERLPLGWIHALPNRINNLYPIGWRIRMRESA
jgi:16S rRNA C967 or C1407 C5-methylase (RsmB/RsmF family)/NOL1/NOP2/fmu family ribosome biogenesis protein